MRCRSDARLWQCFKLLSFRGVASDTQSLHSIPTPLSYIQVMNNLFVRIMGFIFVIYIVITE